jgi:hypothetical protein
MKKPPDTADKAYSILSAVLARNTAPRPLFPDLEHTIRRLVAAGAFGFLIFSHALDGPDLYGASNPYYLIISSGIRGDETQHTNIEPGILSLLARGSLNSRDYF